jgi:putative peptidoglycan lipid II flippase
LQPGFFAREDTVTPTIFAGVSVAINIVLSLALFPQFQHVGIALATSAAAWVNAALLAIWLRRRGHFILAAAEWRRHGLILVAALVMAGALYGLSLPLAPAFAAEAALALQLAALALLVATGLVIYFAFAHFSGAQPLGPLLARLRRTA